MKRKSIIKDCFGNVVKVIDSENLQYEAFQMNGEAVVNGHKVESSSVTIKEYIEDLKSKVQEI